MNQGVAHLFGYPTKSGVGLQSSLKPNSLISTLKISRFAVHNRTSGAIDVGLLKKLPNSSWQLQKLVAADTPDATDVTEDIQAGVATTVFETTNDGILIQSRKRFGLVRFTASQASVNLTPVLQYFNGSAYVTLPTIEILANFANTSVNYLVFAPPIGWRKGTTLAIGGDSGSAFYNIKFTSSTTTTTDPILTALDVGEFIRFKDSVASNGILELTNTREFPLELEAGEDLMPYFGASNNDNIVEATYLLVG